MYLVRGINLLELADST